MRGAALAALLAVAALGVGAASAGYDWRLPPGVKPPPVPADNPMSDAKVELGRRLFYDADLSVDGTLSCAGCHEQNHAFADPNRNHAGVHGEPGRRNVPGLANVAYLSPLTWADPTQRTLEQQVSTPVSGQRPIEMGMHAQEAEIVRRLAGDACYRRQFAEAFPETGGRVDFPSTVKALATFERTLLAWDTPYDRSRRGGPSPLPDALRGERRFAAACAGCHAGPQFSDGRFHALRPPAPDASDLGLFEVTGEARDRGAFRTPPLRNVAQTAPYLHDGSASTLAEALDAHAGLRLTGGEKAEFVAFLGTLSDPVLLTDARFALPRRACGAARTH